MKLKQGRTLLCLYIHVAELKELKTSAMNTLYSWSRFTVNEFFLSKQYGHYFPWKIKEMMMELDMPQTRYDFDEFITQWIILLRLVSRGWVHDWIFRDKCIPNPEWNQDNEISCGGWDKHDNALHRFHACLHNWVKNVYINIQAIHSKTSL